MDRFRPTVGRVVEIRCVTVSDSRAGAHEIMSTSHGYVDATSRR